MIEIKRIERFNLRGKEFKSLREVYIDTENHLGAIIDSFDVTLTPKQRLNILSGIVHNKTALIATLSIVFDMSDDSMNSDVRNILDMDGVI
jgi:hypothetical protein